MTTSRGVKLDSGKLRWDLLPFYLLEGIVKVLTFGAQKYTDNGWQEVDNGYERYKAAFFRHYFEHEYGESVDKDSKLEHIDHMLTNLLFMKHFYLKEKKELKCDVLNANQKIMSKTVGLLTGFKGISVRNVVGSLLKILRLTKK